MAALSAIRPERANGNEKVFGLSEFQIARGVKAITKAARLADWECFSGYSGRVGMDRRMAQNGAPPPKSSARAAGSRASAWSTAKPEASPPGRSCVICNRLPIRLKGQCTGLVFSPQSRTPNICGRSSNRIAVTLLRAMRGFRRY